MKTYKNVSEEPITVDVDTGETVKQHAIEPGAVFSFCEHQDNAQAIIDQLTAAGAVVYTQPG